MNNKIIKGNKANNSKFMPSLEMLKSLNAIDPSVGSTVTYVFQTPRIKFNKENPDGLSYMYESRMVQALSSSALVTVGATGKKLRRNDVEVCRMLEDIREDIGATSFTIN
jgi:hypothetical protein